MTLLATGDVIQIGNFGGQTARSCYLKETSFFGFKYEPKHGNRVLLDSLVYPQVLVNEGNPWKPSSKSATSPLSGYC